MQALEDLMIRECWLSSFYVAFIFNSCGGRFCQCLSTVPVVVRTGFVVLKNRRKMLHVNRRVNPYGCVYRRLWCDCHKNRNFNYGLVFNFFRFMLQDVIELRDNHWLPRKTISLKESPKPIQEIRREAHDELGISDGARSPTEDFRYLQIDPRRNPPEVL